MFGLFNKIIPQQFDFHWFLYRSLICNLMPVVYRNVQVHDLLKLYSEIDVPPERLLFKIPSTWQVSIQIK